MSKLRKDAARREQSEGDWRKVQVGEMYLVLLCAAEALPQVRSTNIIHFDCPRKSANCYP